MKKTLLLLFVCLFGALGGVKAEEWTPVNPVRTRVYCLYHPGKDKFFYASNSAIGNTNRYYGVTSNMAEVTPILIETTGDGSYNWTISYYDNANTKGWIYENNGNSYTASLTSSQSLGVEVDNDTNKKYFLRHYKSNNEKRYLNGNNDDNTCTFPTSSGGAYKDWQFIAYEDVLPSVVEAKAPICASAAEASYVSGWEKVTTKEQLTQNPERYFYAFFSAVNPGVMLETYTSGTYPNRLCYRTATTPTSSWTTLYELEGKGEFFAFKSCATGNYFANSSGAPWDYFANVTEYNDNCKTTISSNSGAWTIQAANEDETQWRDPVYHGSYAGSWDNYEHVGERLAANKSIERAGYFLIYRIPKSRMANVDMTALMPTGINDWTCVQGNGPAQYLTTGATETYSDNGDTYKIFKAGKIMYQTVTNMPRGKYQVTFYAVVNSANGKSSVSGPNLVQAYVNDETLDIDVINQSSCTPSDYSRSITCTLDEYGSLEYGLKVKDGVTDAGNWALCKNVSLTYLGETLEQEANVFATPQDVTGDIWYKYTGASAGWYMITSNAATTLSYAQDGTKSVGDNDFSTISLAAGVSKCITLAAGTLYFKSNAATTLTLTPFVENLDMTSCITNPNFDSNLDGWTPGNFEIQSGNEHYSGKFAEMWAGSGNLAAGDLNQTITSLPAGIYRLTAKSWADISCHLYASIGGVKQELSYQTAEAVDRNLTFAVATTSDVVIGIYHEGKTGVTGSTWVSCDNFRLTYLGDASAEMAVNADAKWGTFCAPFAVAIPSGVTAYTCESATAGVLNLEEVATTIPANTPVILNAESGLASTTFYGVKVANATDDLITGGWLRGNVSTSAKDIAYTGNEYLLQRNNNKTGFYKMDNTHTYKVGYNRCYLVMPIEVQARDAYYMDGDDFTGINSVEAAEAEGGTLKDGKYLIEGKIVLVKNGVKFGANGQKLN